MKTIFVNDQPCEVKDIDFYWLHPMREDVSQAWDEWLYGTTPQELVNGFKSPEDAISHFLTDVIDNNLFGLSKEELEEIDIDSVGSRLLAYCTSRLETSQ